MDLLIWTRTDKWQTRPFVREGAPDEQGSNFHIRKKNLVMSPSRGQTPRQTDWRTVSRNVTWTWTWTWTWTELQFLVEFWGSRIIEQEMSRRFHRHLKCQFLCWGSVARRRLVKTENPSACAAVNWKCVEQRSRYDWVWLRKLVTEVAINPVIRSRTRYFRHA
jgi:hypothetical protein